MITKDALKQRTTSFPLCALTAIWKVSVFYFSSALSGFLCVSLAEQRGHLTVMPLGNFTDEDTALCSTALIHSLRGSCKSQVPVAAQGPADRLRPAVSALWDHLYG